MKVYRDYDDWWIGYYRGPNHHYVCPLPTLVIRWPRCRCVHVGHGDPACEDCRTEWRRP